MPKFELKQEHIDLISELNFRSIVSSDGGEIEYRPAIDYKRPFGNSGVTYDVLQRFGLTDDNGNYTEADRKKAKQLIIELPVALEIVVKFKTFEPGEYEVDNYSPSYVQYEGYRNLLFWEDAIEKFKESFSDADYLVKFCMNCFEENPYKFLEELRLCKTNNYMEKADEVFEEYAVDKWIASHDGTDYCQYCPENDECHRGMVCYGGEPIEPPCCGADLKEFLYTDSIIEGLIAENT